MRLRSSTSLAVRRRLLSYAKALAGPDGNIIPHPPPGRQASGPIWFYWGQEVSRAPELVRSCFRTAHDFSDGRSVVPLDDGNIESFVSLPRFVMLKKERMGRTHFSDILRSALLAQYGGTWMDATVYLTGPITPYVTGRPFFAFTRPEDPFLLSSWFIHAEAGHPLMTAELEMLYRYWSEQDVLIDYFLFHFLFECGVTLCEPLRRHWLHVPEISFLAPHGLQACLLQVFDERRFRNACQATPIHKLTWKLDPEKCQDEHTFYSYLKNGVQPTRD